MLRRWGSEVDGRGVWLPALIESTVAMFMPPTGGVFAAGRCIGPHSRSNFRSRHGNTDRGARTVAQTVRLGSR